MMMKDCKEMVNKATEAVRSRLKEEGKTIDMAIRIKNESNRD